MTTSNQILRKYLAGERDFRRENIKNQSFKGQDLSGADFSGADIRGANFNGTQLRNARFIGAKAGLEAHWASGWAIIAWVSFLWLLVFLSILLISQILPIALLTTSTIGDTSGANSINAAKDLAIYAYSIYFVSTTLVLLVFLSLAIFQGWNKAFLKSFYVSAALAILMAATGAGTLAFTIVQGLFTGISLNIITFLLNLGFIVLYFCILFIVITLTIILSNVVLIALAVGLIIDFTVGGIVWISSTLTFLSFVTFIITADIFSNDFNIFNGLNSFIGLINFLVLILFPSSDVTIKVFILAISIEVLLMLLFGSYIAWRVLIGDEKHRWIRKIAIALVSIGGTNFQNANLTNADFMKANLKCVNFKDAILTRVNWHQAKKLHQTRTNNVSLLDSGIRNLVVSHRGASICLIGRNLRGINLAGADLGNADLSETDISEATFEQGCLEGVNLSRVKALGTSFEGARLTGACIENWKIDKTTSITNVICDYVYLQANSQERRPASGSFAQGDFTRLFEKVLETVDLIFQNGIDWKAFLSTFQELQVQYGEQNLSIQSIEQKRDGAFVIRINIPVDLDKARVEREVKGLYQKKLQALQAKYRKELQAKERDIERYERQNANLFELAKLAASRPIRVEAKAVAENQSNSENYNTDLRGANVGNFANKVQDNAQQQARQHNTLEQKQTLTEAAIEIQKLLEQLEEVYPSTTKAEQAIVAAKAVEEIENNAALKQRVIGALKAGGTEALKELVDHPAVGIVLAAVEGWQNPE